MKTLLNSFKKLRHYVPLSLTGVFITAFSFYALYSPISESSDIVLAMFCGIIACGYVVMFLINLLIFIKLKKTGDIKVNIYPGSPKIYEQDETTKSLKVIKNSKKYTPQEFRAAEHHTFVIELTKSWILPFFNINAVPKFDSKISNFSFNFKNTQKHQLSTIVFPHRGKWSVKEVDFTISDSLGIFKFKTSKTIERPANVKVYPSLTEKRVDSGNVVLQKAGELLPHPTHISDDYYDLKAYQPGDSANRIVWKVYAKHSTLISRKPERSYNPENKIALFLLATRDDDEICDATVKFVKKLIENGTNTVANCASANPKMVAVNSPTELREKTVNSAWYKSTENWPNDFLSFIKAIDNEDNNYNSESLTCFLIASSKFCASNSGSKIVNQCIEKAKKLAVSVTVISTNDIHNFKFNRIKENNHVSKNNLNFNISNIKIKNHLSNWFLES